MAAGKVDARFNQPNCVAADLYGNLFVTESSNAYIRKIVVSTQTVTTVGGTGFGNFPSGVAVSPLSGAIYVSDTGNNLVRVLPVPAASPTCTDDLVANVVEHEEGRLLPALEGAAGAGGAGAHMWAGDLVEGQTDTPSVRV